MSHVIGHDVLNGVPWINGRRAVHDPPKADEDRTIVLLDGAFSEWRCPECKGRLSAKHLICLNACHLSAPSFARFQAGMREACARVARQKKLIEEGKIVEAVGDLDRE